MKIGVCLSGCGFLDGAEIQESVGTLLALDQAGVEAECCAPNVELDVIDHLTGQPTGEKRNVLAESARIARGRIRDVADVRGAELDGLIFPGGYGAAKNLCNFAAAGTDCVVHPEVERLVGEMLDARKPIGVICIAPAMLARILGRRGVAARLTIGDDAGTAAALNAMGVVHCDCAVTAQVTDERHRIASTPAYMLGRGPAEVFAGIKQCVDAVLNMAGAK